MGKQKTHTSIDFYNFIKSKYDWFNLDFYTYRKFLVDFGTLMSYDVIDKGKEMLLPHHLGKIAIYKKKQYYTYKNKYTTDRKLSTELKMDVFFSNEHTNGYVFKFFWLFSNNKSSVELKRYEFVMTRTNKRHLAKLLKARVMDYPEREKNYDL